METIRIPNLATYAPVALTDMLVGGPMASRLLLGFSAPGRLLSTAALGLYAASAMADWAARRGVRRIDFLAEFGADVFHLEEMPKEERHREITELGEKLNDGYVADRPPRAELAPLINHHLTGWIAGITDQWVETSSEIRTFSLAQFAFPFAYGTCDVISGDVAIFKDTGLFEPHLIAHEFVHRKGYWKELHAQVVAYLAMKASGEPVLVQAAEAERLHRHLRVLSDDDPTRFHEEVGRARLRPELEEALLALRPVPATYEAVVSRVMRRLYDERMKLTGQNGLSDYDEGFTNFLWTWERSKDAGRRAGA